MTDFKYTAYLMDMSKFISLVQKIIALHRSLADMSDAEKRFWKMVEKIKKRNIKEIPSADVLKCLQYIFATSPIKKYELVKFNGELLGI